MGMNRPILITFSVLLLFTSVSHGEVKKDSWRWERSIRTDEEEGYCQVEVTPEIYEASRMDLGDIRIVDNDGNHIPYLLDDSTLVHGETLGAAVFDLAGQFKKKEATYFEFMGESSETSDIQINQLTASVDGNREFFKYITLFGSHDMKNWEWVCDDSIYLVDGRMHNRWQFPSPLKFTAYRIVILDNNGMVRLKGLSGELRRGVEEIPKRTLDFKADQMDIIEKGTNTFVVLPSLKNLPLNAISIEASGLYHRFCRLLEGSPGQNGSVLGSGYLYQTEFKTSGAERNALEVDIGIPYDGLTLEIFNGDNAPLNIEAIHLTYLADRIVFKAENDKRYVLRYGNLEALPPNYDIEAFRQDILSQKKGSATLGEAQALQNLPKVSAYGSQKAFFNSLVLMTAVVLGWLAVRGMKKTTAE